MANRFKVVKGLTRVPLNPKSDCQPPPSTTRSITSLHEKQPSEQRRNLMHSAGARSRATLP